MSVSKNIPQHPAPSRTDRTLAHDALRDSHFNRIVGLTHLDASVWASSRPTPTDGRHTRRVQKQMNTANTQRMRRLIRGHVISKV